MRINEFRKPPVSKTICSVSPLQDLYPSLHPRIVNVTILLEGCNDSPRMTIRDLTSLTFIMCGEVPDSTLKYGDDILRRFTFDWMHSLFILRNCRMNAPQWTIAISHLLSPSVTLNNPPDLTHCLSSQEKLSSAFPPHERCFLETNGSCTGVREMYRTPHGKSMCVWPPHSHSQQWSWCWVWISVSITLWFLPSLAV